MIANIVNELVVLCPNAKRGCPVSVARYLVEGHLREECGFVEVGCRGEGCEERTLRRDVEGECVHRKVACEHCDERVRKMDLEVGRSSGLKRRVLIVLGPLPELSGD